MFIIDRMKTSHLMEHAIDTESLRRRVISNNISNVDVPHFKRSEVNFESELNRAINERSAATSAIPAIMTSDRHIPFYISRSPLSVNPRVNSDYNSSYRNDGNNVDIEKEIVDSAKNLMRYNAFSQMIGGSYNKLKMVMRTIA